MNEVPDDRQWAWIGECGEFADHAGMIYMTQDRLESDEDVRFGFRVAPHHCNRRPQCHGGMMATFLDIALARGLRVVGQVEPPLPTISLSIDFMKPAPLDAWVEARVRLGRVGKSTGFIAAWVYADDALAARGSGVFRHFGKEISGN
ncbi:MULTISPECIES: PaaI family thioesterase [unclassified Novosphingobium]|uniref:PaaI family thioesterase n=1 Tax=unclassified Novosphingobium TaxID=2644732 RepID=UPI000D30FFE4|nr:MULTISPECIES: PaaI family thioesterase [unclassified Novosphingobium]